MCHIIFTFINLLSSIGRAGLRFRSWINFSFRRRFSLNLFRCRFDKSPEKGLKKSLKTVVEATLAELSFQTPEDSGSNPVINISLLNIYKLLI